MTADLADIIAGELKTSRAHAYELMRRALAESTQSPAEAHGGEQPGTDWLDLPGACEAWNSIRRAARELAPTGGSISAVLDAAIDLADAIFKVQPKAAEGDWWLMTADDDDGSADWVERGKPAPAPGFRAVRLVPADVQPKDMVLIGWQYRDANDDGTWGAWLGCDKRLEPSQWRQVRGVYAAAPDAAQAPAPAHAGDRQMLLTIMQELDNSVWNCEHCGHAEDTKTMDVAYMLRRYLASAAAPAPEFDVRRIMLDVVPGEDGMGDEVYAKSVADVEAVLTRMGERIEELESRTQAPAVAHSQAALDVLAERQRQISAEGWTPEHDDQHADGSLALAAGCYALHHDDPGLKGAPAWWPWHASWWKPKDSYRNLVKAGALIVAELERLRRASKPVQGSGS